MSKEHVYAYEAGYRDGSIHYELEHCPACKNVADLQEALAENAKLREQGARLFDKTLELGTENDGLRELVRGMLHDAMENICSKAYWCVEKSWQTCNNEKCGNRLYVEMARELGVVE